MYGNTTFFMFGFFLFLAFPIFSVPSADASTVLTDGKESSNANFFEKMHSFFCKRVRIEGFDRNAQCFVEVGADTIGSFSLVLQFEGVGMLGKDGLTICYVGQLDPSFTTHGLAPINSYRISNVPDNDLSKICAEGKEKLTRGNDCLDPECYEFVIREWHAIQFKEDPNGRDLLMTMSTSRETFRIPRDQLENDLLVFKFTTANGYTARFSKTIGPGQKVGKRPTVMEKKSVVKVEMDEKMEQKYLMHVHAGARLEQFNAPYALSVDFLPSMEGIRDFDVFVIRSECSDVPATFLTPTDLKALHPIERYKEKNNTKFVLNLQLNSTSYFRGYVPKNTTEFSVQYNFKRKLAASKIRMTVKFDGKGDFGIPKFETFKNGEWEPRSGENLDKVKFYQGQQFMFKVLSKEKDFFISVNCAEYAKISRGVNLPKLQTIWTEVHNVVIYDFWNHGLKDAGRVAEIIDVNLKPRMGYFIKATPGKEWSKIAIELQHEEETTIDVILHFEVDVKPNELSITAPQEEEFTEKNDKIEENVPFEMLFDLYDNEVVVYIDGDRLCAMPYKGKEPLDVNKIQIEADFELHEKLATYGTPMLYKIISVESKYNFRGRVMKSATGFQIGFYDIGKEDKLAKCFDANKINCLIVLYFEIDFVNGTAFVGDFLPRSASESVKTWNKIVSNAKFHPGDEFKMTIVFEAVPQEGYKLDYGNGQMDFFAIQRKKSISKLGLTGDVFYFEIPQ